jgi:uncharacterized RDD family membrane protein YckC
VHNQHNFNSTDVARDYVPAPNGPRLQAFIIDAIFYGALTQFLGVALKSLFKSESEFLCGVIVTVAYLALPLVYSGQTLGKKIFGLKVLPLDDDRPLNLKEALLREVIGRPLSFFTFGIGIFSILWRHDRRALHDLIGKTVVMQEAAVAERKGSFFINMGKSFLVSNTLSAISLAFFFYSSFIADRIEAKLTAQGVKIADVSGSPAEGFVIRGLVLEKEGINFELGQAEIKFTDYLKIFSDRTLTIEHFKVSDTKLKLSDGSDANTFIIGFGMGVLGIVPSEKEIQESEPPRRRQKFRIESVRIKEFSIASTSITDSKRTTELNLVINEFNINPETKAFKWNGFDLNSGDFTLRTKEIAYENQNLILNAPIAARVSQIPKFKLKQPLDLVATFGMTKGKLQNLQLNAIGTQVTVISKNGNDYQMWLTGFNPNAYLEGIPFETIDAYSSQKSLIDLFMKAPSQAKFKLGNASFVYSPKTQTYGADAAQTMLNTFLSDRVEATHRTYDDEIKMTLPPGFLLTLVMGGGRIELGNLKGHSPEQILSQLQARDPLNTAKHFVPGAVRIPATQPLSNQPYRNY